MNKQNVVHILRIVCQRYKINPDELKTSKLGVKIYIGKDGEPKPKKIYFATIKASKPKRNKGLSPQVKILRILKGK